MTPAEREREIQLLNAHIGELRRLIQLLKEELAEAKANHQQGLLP